MTEPSQVFFTAKSMLTFGGASAGVVVVTKTIRTLFKWDSPWPAFIVSVVICFAGAYSAKALNGPENYLVNFLNSCLLFCTALGMNEATADRQDLRSRTTAQDKEKKAVDWRSSWLE